MNLCTDRKATEAGENTSWNLRSIKMSEEILLRVTEIVEEIPKYDEEEQVNIINQIKIMLHEISPLKDEPVDCVLWIKNDQVVANDYNPNSVAPPEMKLLEHSITQDGYTQPIVSWVNDGKYEVVDGFHRNRVGKESETVSNRVKGYLPLTIIKPDREGRNDRIAATIRHNRARGKHSIDSMAEIVLELKRRNWSDKKIGRELGMDPDEVLRLSQITGLAEMFANKEFSEAWEADESIIDYDDSIEISEKDTDKKEMA